MIKREQAEYRVNEIGELEGKLKRAKKVIYLLTKKVDDKSSAMSKHDFKKELEEPLSPRRKT